MYCLQCSINATINTVAGSECSVEVADKGTGRRTKSRMCVAFAGTSGNVVTLPCDKENRHRLLVGCFNPWLKLTTILTTALLICSRSTFTKPEVLCVSKLPTPYVEPGIDCKFEVSQIFISVQFYYYFSFIGLN